MRIIDKGKYLHVLPQGTLLDTDLFLGWRQKKNDPWIIVENNLVNRLVLGLGLDMCKRNVPDTDFVEPLEPYQQADVVKMLQLEHVLNANPMGLGKTPETAVYLKKLKAKSILIVTPKIIREQWVNQLKTWADIDADIYEGQTIVSPNRAWIVNYDKLRNESVLTKFKSFRWDVLVLDEAHKIKNRTSKQTQAAKNIPAGRRVALTGTPILRYVDDLWSILNFLDVKYSGISYWNFVSYFCNVKTTPWGNKIEGLTQNPAKVAILNTLIDTVSIRNKAVEVAHGKTIERILLPMSKKQRELYRDAKNLVLDNLPDNMTIPNGAVLTLRLSQITTWPGLFIPGEFGSKFEWVLETCQNNPEEKFVVFTRFERAATALAQLLNDSNVPAVTITGTNQASVNSTNKKLFIDSKVQVLVGTIGAMGQGYDGLQHVCRLAIFLDRDWSPGIMEQAEDRLHRRGQDSPVNIYYLECQGSFDQYVGKINVNKSSDIRKALEECTNEERAEAAYSQSTGDEL